VLTRLRGKRAASVSDVGDGQQSGPDDWVVHQLTTGFAAGDAISDHCDWLSRRMVEMGYHTATYARHVDTAKSPHILPWTELRPHPKKRNLVLFHYSIGNELPSHLLRLGLPIILIYHNITPPEFFEAYNPTLARLQKQGREELSSLVALTVLALGDSEYNRRELVSAGFTRTDVLPISVDWDRYDIGADVSLLTSLKDGSDNFLFVGRIAPNKRQDDLVRLFALYARHIRPRSRLILVGSWSGTERYLAELRDLTTELGIADRVLFAGHVGQRELVTYYRAADVFVCASEHEGFCVPLLEAMYFGMPILARGAAAVPHTLGDSGILYHGPPSPVVAEMAHLMVADTRLRERVIEQQHQRLAAFHPDKISSHFRALLSTALKMSN
jgi:L-malate glycosyltransferase